MNTKLPWLILAARFRYAVPFVLLLVVIYLTGIHPWMTNWGSTAAEQQIALPGDDLFPDRTRQSTLAITIDAPPDVIWQWLAQVGQDRAGFYSYTWLENLLGVDIHNTNEIRREWQQLDVGGDAWRMMPADYLGGVGKDSARKVLISEPGRALVLEMWGAYVILPVNEHTSRLIVRGEAMPDSLLMTMIVEPMVFTMNRRMLLGLKARAEGRPDAPPALLVISWIGWAAAGIAVAGLFLSRRQRRYWLALPIAAALPALLMAHDAQAGLAAFTAAGITLLGFLVFGRSWWGPYIILGSTVLLVLLLAPEAFTAIGSAFALLLLAALGTAAAGLAARSSHQRQTAVP